MKFSEKLIHQTNSAFLRMRGKVGEELFNQVENEIGRQKDELSFLLKWIYVNSPVSDWESYDFALFLSIAEHGLFLARESEFAKNLPEDVFLSYVLHPRVNDEELSDCRKFFYSRLRERLCGLSAENAALIVNDFCAENVSYRGSDDRTRSALSAFTFSTGRCGEESVFAVNALRAVGLPARQIYAPRWSHCDDNHAWVEVLTSDGWHYFGACEPEEILDSGWFTAAASRAMLAYARCFGRPPKGEEVLFSEGPLRYLNVLPRYADCKRFRCRVFDGHGVVKGAEVQFEILNYSRFVPVAKMKTDSRGEVSLALGLGSVRVRARKDELFQETLVDTRGQSGVEIRLGGARREGLERFVFAAPEGRPCADSPNEAQQKKAKERRARAQKLRERKVAPNRADGKYGKILATLSEKDRQDVDDAVLQEASLWEERVRGDADERIFYEFVVCPRVDCEPLFPHREKLLRRISDAEKKRFLQSPEKLAARILKGKSVPPAITRFYPDAAGALGRSGKLEERQKDVLFVQVCRTLGIPARLSPTEKSPQYFRDGEFREARPSPRAELILKKQSGTFPIPKIDFGLERILPTEEREICLDKAAWRGDFLELNLCAGEYCLVTQNRLPSGDLLAVCNRFRLEKGERRIVELIRSEPKLSELSIDIPLEELPPQVRKSDVFVFAEPGAEPTEHFLQELSELLPEERFDPCFFSEKPQLLPSGLRSYPASFDLAEKIARKLYVEPGKFPLVVVVREGRAKFVSAGYSVGSVDLVKKILRLS